jgi:hypothetical protein
MVNTSAITNIEDCGDYSVIYFMGNSQLTVRESWTAIQSMLGSSVETSSSENSTTTPNEVTSNNAHTPGRVLLDLTELISDAFRYDSDTERDVLLKGNSVYLICCKYSTVKSLMASNIRNEKPVFDGCGNGGNGWVYYTRISDGNIIESDGIDVPSSRNQKIREVLNDLLDKYK